MEKHRGAVALLILIAFAAQAAACNATPNHPFAAASSIETTAESTAAVSPAPVLLPFPPSMETPAAPDSTPDATASLDAGADMEDAPQYDIPDLENLGISDSQYDKIHWLLIGALQMSDNSERFGGSPGYFSNASSLPAKELLAFAHDILTDGYDAIGMADSPKDGPIAKGIVESIVRSAFNIQYTPKEGDHFRDMLMYGSGVFTFTYAEAEYGIDACTYSATRVSANRLLLRFNMVDDNDVCDTYMGKGQAVIEADKDSLFGYHLVSMQKDKENFIRFSSASASSALPSKGSKTFVAVNAIDRKDKTAWAVSNAIGNSITLEFGKPQDITGLNLSIGDWSSEDNFYKSGQPEKVRLDFSDGSSIEEDSCGADDIGCVQCITFGKAIHTTYVKVTILTTFSYEDTSTGTDYDSNPAEANTYNTYITDVSPF